jgi:hypothetical protein
MTEFAYHLDDPLDAQRLLELSGNTCPTALEGELHLTRLFAEKLANRGDLAGYNEMVNTIAKLSQASETAKFRRGDLLAKTAVLELAGKMVEILSCTVANRFPGWEDAIANAKQDMLTLVCEAKNPEESEK